VLLRDLRAGMRVLTSKAFSNTSLASLSGSPEFSNVSVLRSGRYVVDV